MADTKVQAESHDWVRSHYLPQRYGQTFSARSVRLFTGREKLFAAVSADDRIVGSIRTSEAVTSAGKRGVGKLSKIVEDLYYLMLVECDQRIMLFTAQSMFALFNDSKQRGKIPKDIQGLLVTPPDDLRTKLRGAQSRASQEVGG